MNQTDKPISYFLEYSNLNKKHLDNMKNSALSSKSIKY